MRFRNKDDFQQKENVYIYFPVGYNGILKQQNSLAKFLSINVHSYGHQKIIAAPFIGFSECD